MTPEQNRAKTVFLNAVEIAAAAERQAYVEAQCGNDEVLRHEVEELLRHHAAQGSFLEAPVEGRASTIALPEAPERPGALIGPYKLLEPIGEGGMGTVWMAQQTEPVKRLVAVKLVKAGMDSRQVIARFEAERQALALMDHANIARVLEAGTTRGEPGGVSPGRPYFVMDLVKGVPIARYCDEHHLTLRQRLELFIPVCQAVQHAHQKGIIHRDLKPSNILVAPYDGKPVVKVIDFGVAKAAGQQLTDRTLVTGFGAIVGTLEYMSPEQAELNNQDIDTRSDIYSLGVLLYELLTGSTPFSHKALDAAGLLDTLRTIREQEPTKPSKKLSTAERLPTLAANRGTEPAKLTKLIRGELDWIVMKALEKDRSRRYETASAFAADVQRYLRDEPVEACPPSAWYRFRKFARRNQRGLLTAAVVALAVLLTAAVSGVLIWQANQDLHQALDRERLTAYLQRIALAEREWAANNLSRMEQLLDACPQDLRGWEWRYLKRLRYGALAPLRHESGVYCVAFSHDSEYLATATKEGFVRLWRAKTGQELRKWHAHAENATCIQFSPDSRYLASGGWDEKVKVWDVQKVLQGEVQAPILQLEHTSRVWGVSFSPDGQRLASAGGRSEDVKGVLKVWDVSTGQATLTLSSFPSAVRCVQFSPDGRRLATGTARAGGLVQLWDAQTGQEQLPLRSPNRGDFEAVAFRPDGRRLAAVGGLFRVHPDRQVEVWDTQTGEQLLSLSGHVAALRSVAFSPDGRRLASTGLDQTVKLWDAATGQEVLTLRGHIDNVFGVAFSPDGHQIASASADKTVRIWDATPVEGEAGLEYRTLRGHTGAVTDVAFHPKDGRTLASADTDGRVRVWDFRSGQNLGILPESPSAFRLRVAYSPDGRRLAVASGDRPDVKVWDVATAKAICTFGGHDRDALCVAFSLDGRHVASAGFDFTVRVWDATTGKEIQGLKGHDWPVHGVAFSPDGRHLASCSADSTVRVWDRTTVQELRVLEPRHAARVYGVAFSRDGERLASASWDRTIKVWDTATWKLLHDVHDSLGAAAQCVAFGPDRRRLAWGSTDSTVKVWDGPGTATHVLRGHTSWVQAVAFSPDGQWIASASLDGTVKVWKAPPEPAAPAPEAGDQGK
jgi:WD40 repeat protein/serine/threonine protein kinase